MSKSNHTTWNELNLFFREISLLSKKFSSQTDGEQKTQIQRELYFLSRKLASKKKQINEIHDLYLAIRQNCLR